MFKRVLVLVLFLFGVFWWLTNRGGDEAENTEKKAQVEVIENAEVEGSEAEEETEEASTEEDKSKAEGDGAAVDVKKEVDSPKVVETKPAAKPVVSLPKTVTKPVVKPVVPVKPKAVVAPVVPATITPAPEVVEVEIPNRTTDVKVYVYEWGLDLSKRTIPSGTVNFMVDNNGRFTHDFSLSGFGNLGKVMPKQKSTFTLKLKPGEYEAFSDRRQDYDRGVVKQFVVTP